MIIHCWYQILISLSPIDDIIKIMIACSEEYEKFEALSSYGKLYDGMKVKFYSYTSGTHTVVGSAHAAPGYIYHWMKTKFHL